MDFEDIMIEEQKEVIEAIKKNGLYDFISSNYYRLDRDILLDLLKEAIAMLTGDIERKQLIENLKEYRDWEVE